MRRGFSISLVLLFLLTPLASWLPGIDEANLPMCCRRHGNHHCATSSDAAASADGTHSVKAPANCPLYAAATPATLAAFLLPEPATAALPEHQRIVSPASIQPVHASPRTLADRGPPSAS